MNDYGGAEIHKEDRQATINLLFRVSMSNAAMAGGRRPAGSGEEHRSPTRPQVADCIGIAISFKAKLSANVIGSDLEHRGDND